MGGDTLMHDPKHPDSLVTAARARIRLEQERQRKELRDRQMITKKDLRDRQNGTDKLNMRG